MPVIGDAALALARNLGRVAQEIIGFRTKGSKLTVLQQIFRGIKRAAKPMGDILINTFKNLGPEIAKLLPELTKFFRVIARNEGPILIIVRAMRKLLERFNDLPGPMKDFIVKAGAVALILKATGAGSIIGGLARLAGQYIAVKRRSRRNESYREVAQDYSHPAGNGGEGQANSG